MIESAATLRTVAVEEIRAAADRIAGAVRRTPLLPAELPDALGGGTLWLKCENFQHVSAFKARGAYNFVSLLSDDERQAGLVSYSSGNHAQAVAFAARTFGVPATIVMPMDAPEVKLEGTKRLGARVEQVGTTSAERFARADEILREEGGTMVPPFDHPNIIAGQGTVGLEIVEQLRTDPGGPRQLGLVLAPIGGGGLASGTAAAIRALAPESALVGVEPTGAAAMLRSLEAGGPVTLDRIDTIADGLKPVRPGDLTYLHMAELAREVVTVEDDQIRDAVRWLFDRRLVVEPSGAATVAAILSGAAAPSPAGETVAVISGGNVDPILFAEWLTR